MIETGDRVYALFTTSHPQGKTLDVLVGIVSRVQRTGSHAVYYIDIEHLFTRKSNYIGTYTRDGIIPFGREYVYKDNNDGRRRVISRLMELK